MRSNASEDPSDHHIRSLRRCQILLRVFGLDDIKEHVVQERTSAFAEPVTSHVRAT